MKVISTYSTPVLPKPPAPRCVSSQLVDFVERCQRHRGGDELGDALAAADREGLAAVVDEQDLQFAAIVAVDRARRVGDGDAMLEGEARARADLDFIAVRDGDAEAGGDGVALPGREVEILGGDDVHARRAGGGVAGQGAGPRRGAGG